MARSASGPTPRTAPPKAPSPRASAGPFDPAAAPVWRFLDELPDHAARGEPELARRAGLVLADFAEALLRAGVPRTAIPPARYALGVLIDQRARAEKRLRPQVWAAAAQVQVFDGRDMGAGDIRRFRDTARDAGYDYADLAAFLDGVLARIDGKRREGRRRAQSGWVGWTATAVVTLAGLIVAYALSLEQRFQSRLWQAFDAERLAIGLDLPRSGADLVARLDRLAAARDRVSVAAATGPLGRVMAVPLLDSRAPADAAYADALARQVPPELVRHLSEALATDGDALATYDSLRAMAVLDGTAPWSPAWLAGWLDDREEALGLRGLDAHVARLAAPPADRPAWDRDLTDQARAFAATLPEPDRAFLELARSDAAAALPDWVAATAIPALPQAMTRRSGAPLAEPIDGLFTAAGWDHARREGTGTAVQRARDLAPAILGTTPPTRNDTPDLIMDRLQAETLATWRDWLADLRVKPFADRDGSILVSGLLAQRNSPLAQLLSEVWVQVGGTDRARPFGLQQSIATTFGPMIQYVEQGRLDQIAALFGALNVALASFDFDDDRGADRLMGVQDRAQSVAALQTAPRIVVQIVEDVLAQSAAAQSSAMGNPLTRRWQQDVYTLCRQVTDGTYPFAAGPDADIDAFSRLFGPGGAVDRFFRTQAERYIDTSESPWRWKPEARFNGLTPETAEFFQRALAVSAGYFAPSGDLGGPMTLAALAERGQALVAIGGQAVPVRATGDPATLQWPGAQPQAGAEVSFTDGAAQARLIQPGPWGFLRLMDGTRLRPRDDGRRFLVDMRADVGRVFLEVDFPATPNPLAARALLDGLTCPPAL
jgi:type VI protein secretion system component VasK